MQTPQRPLELATVSNWDDTSIEIRPISNPGQGSSLLLTLKFEVDSASLQLSVRWVELRLIRHNARKSWMFTWSLLLQHSAHLPSH